MTTSDLVLGPVSQNPLYISDKPDASVETFKGRSKPSIDVCVSLQGRFLMICKYSLICTRFCLNLVKLLLSSRTAFQWDGHLFSVARASKSIKKRASRTLRISRKSTKEHKKGHRRTSRQKHQEHQEYPEPFSSHALLIKSYLNNFLGKSSLPNHLPSNPSSEVCYSSAETALWLPGWKNSLKPVSSLALFPFSLPWNKVWL